MKQLSIRLFYLTLGACLGVMVATAPLATAGGGGIAGIAQLDIVRVAQHGPNPLLQTNLTFFAVQHVVFYDPCPVDQWQASQAWGGDQSDWVENGELSGKKAWLLKAPEPRSLNVRFGVLHAHQYTYYMDQSTEAKDASAYCVSDWNAPPGSPPRAPDQPQISCPLFAGIQTRQTQGRPAQLVCVFESPDGKPRTDRIPAGFTADFWENNRVIEGAENRDITVDRATFKEKR